MRRLQKVTSILLDVLAFRQVEYVVIKSMSILTFLKVLSGQQPWSEVQDDATVILHLSQGYKPSCPTSQHMNDHHWEFIQKCWSPVNDRISSEMVIHFIQGFLNDCPSSYSLKKLFASSSDADVLTLDSTSFSSTMVPLGYDINGLQLPSVCYVD